MLRIAKTTQNIFDCTLLLYRVRQPQKPLPVLLNRRHTG